MTGAKKLALALEVEGAGQQWMVFSLAGSGPALPAIGPVVPKCQPPPARRSRVRPQGERKRNTSKVSSPCDTGDNSSDAKTASDGAPIRDVAIRLPAGNDREGSRDYVRAVAAGGFQAEKQQWSQNCDVEVAVKLH